MKKTEFSPYATNKLCVKAPKNQAKGDPKATVIKGKGYLRAKRG